MFTCLEPRKARHQHATVLDAKMCWGIIKPPAPVDPKDQPGSMTSRQYSYLRSLGASAKELHDESGQLLSINQASALIDMLKSSDRRTEVTNSQSAEDPRLAMLSGMLEAIPSGYYAVRPDSTVNYTFLRISRPKSGNYRGSIKVQTQHSDDLHLRAVRWPSGRWSVYRSSIIEALMLLVVGSQDAAVVYGQEIGKCCRCNKALTDDRSRHYGIGPDCEQVWPWILDLVDEKFGGPYRGLS